MRSAIYIVETDGMKQPPEHLLGSRMVSNSKGLFKSVQPESINEINGDYDGHVNRNIRIAMSLIDMTQPHIEVVNITNINDDT